MDANPILGVLLHAIGGLAAASFYIPYKRIKNWEWESYWLVGGVFSWLFAPLIGAYFICPDLFGVLSDAPSKALFWTYAFGVLWGVGGLTFGLSVRYLGLSLGYSIALGFCATFGTIIPPLYDMSITTILTEIPGLMALLGLVVCLLGIMICGWAGMRKEKELSTEEKQTTIKEFNFMKGLWVAIFAGVMSACMAYAFKAGEPIAEAAKEAGAPVIFSGLPILVVALLGGLTTNFIWCIFLNIKNKSFANYGSAGDASIFLNYAFAALAGVIWYLQFFFYSMGESQMGEYGFSSWTIHMAFIIVFSNIWGIFFKEWKGAGSKTRNLIITGILVLVLATVVVGIGNYLGSLPPV